MLFVFDKTWAPHKTPHTDLSWKQVPVQYREYEYGLFYLAPLVFNMLQLTR